MATAIDTVYKLPEAVTPHTADETQSDHLTFSQHEYCLEAYAKVKEEGKLDAGKNLSFLFASHSINEARYYVNTLNLDFKDYFKFTLTSGAEKHSYSLKLFFTNDASDRRIDFMNKKIKLIFPVSAGLSNHHQNCYVNSALQCFCGFLYRNPMIDFISTHLPIEYAALAVKAKFPDLEGVKTEELAREIQTSPLVKIAASGFKSKENDVKSYQIDQSEFIAFSMMINSLKKLTSTLNSPLNPQKASQDRDEFLSCYAGLLRKHQQKSRFIEIKGTKNNPTWTFRQTGNATEVINEIRNVLCLDGMQEKFGLIQSRMSISNGLTEVESASAPAVTEVKAGLPEKRADDSAPPFSLDNFFKGAVFGDIYNTEQGLNPITWFMCVTPPEKLLVTISETTSKSYLSELTKQIKTVFPRGDLKLLGVLPLIQLLKNNLRVNIPLYLDKNGGRIVVDYTYMADHVICNSGSHYSTLKFTQQGEMIHINDAVSKRISLKDNYKAAEKYIIENKLSSSTYSLHLAPDSHLQASSL